MEFNFENKIILEDKNVRLEPLEEKHFVELLPIALAEQDLLKYSPSPFGSEKKLKENFDISFRQKRENKRYPFAIYDKQKRKYAGSTSLGEISIKDERITIGWTWIGKEFRGTGLNRNCKFLLLSFLFEKLDCKRVEFVTDSRNIISRKAIEGIGGTFEGELRSHVVLPDGHRRNTVIYSILPEEWHDVKKIFFALLLNELNN